MDFTPEYPIEGATYSIYPTLPYSAQFNTTTGDIREIWKYICSNKEPENNWNILIFC